MKKNKTRLQIDIESPPRREFARLPKKKQKLPPYISLALIKLREGMIDEIESSILISTNNINRWSKENNKAKYTSWHKSMFEYWLWVLRVILHHIRTCTTITIDDQNYLASLIKDRVPHYAN